MNNNKDSNFDFKDLVDQGGDVNDLLDQDNLSDDPLANEVVNNDDDDTDIKFGKNISKKKSSSRANKKFTTIVVIGVAVLFGVTFFIIFNLIFNRREPVEPVSNELALDDERVVALYDRVKYGARGPRYYKFVSEPSVTEKNFTNYEKFYYALSLTETSDFRETGTNNEAGVVEYYISSAKIQQYMQEFFGDGVKYVTASSLNYTFDFVKEDKNSGQLNYNADKKRYTIYFTDKVEDEAQNIETIRVYGELSSAKLDGDKIVIKEKVIFPKCNKNASNTYDCIIYRDYENTVKIDEAIGQDPNHVFKPSDYESANVVTYTFKPNARGSYSFESSKLTY